jgi:RIO-like serine/threonine protein kinase fused to N-terminal HTH domain
MLAEPLVQMSPFDMRLVRVIRELQDEVRGLVPSAIVADKMKMKPRTVRYYLRRGEDAGFLFRPEGERSGYSAIQGVVCSLAARDSIERQASTLNALDVGLLRLLAGRALPISGRALPQFLNVSPRTIQRRLQKLEDAELVHRPVGDKSGYQVNGTRAMKVCAWAEAGLMRLKIDPFQMRVLSEMRWRERYCDAMSSRLLSQYMEIPERSMRYYLRQLEGLNLVNRPLGNKAGYRLTDVGIALLDMKGANDGTIN